MYQFILLVVPLVITTNLTAQDCGNARVMKRQGFDIYIFSEPVQEYETIFPVTSGVGGLVQGMNALDNIVQLFIDKTEKLNKKRTKKGESTATNAIIIYSTTEGAAVNYRPNKE